MKFHLADSRHNIFHWLVVILIRVFYSIVLAPLGAYLSAIGSLLSAETFQPYLSPVWFEKAVFYREQLPYFPLIGKLIFAQLNHWYRDAPLWWALVVGIPLILLGAFVFINRIFELLYSLFSPTYNRTHCPFCKEPIKIETK